MMGTLSNSHTHTHISAILMGTHEKILGYLRGINLFSANNSNAQVNEGQATGISGKIVGHRIPYFQCEHLTRM